MKLTFKCVVIYAILFVGIAALASGGDGGIPTSYIGIQTLNLGLTLLALGYFTRKTIKNHFISKREDFHKELNKAKEDKAQAESAHNELKSKISKLETQKEETLKKAHSEAEQLKNKILADAGVLSKKVEDEAGKTAVYEIEKAKEVLREQLIAASFKAATESISGKIDGAKHKKLGSEFIDKIQAVR